VERVREAVRGGEIQIGIAHTVGSARHPRYRTRFRWLKLDLKAVGKQVAKQTAESK